MSADQFRDAIRSAGLNPPDVIKPDGELHRYCAALAAQAISITEPERLRRAREKLRKPAPSSAA